MKFEIKHRHNNDILFSCEGDSWKFAIELAVKSKVSLSCADLRSANLGYADLRSANLGYADLRSANLRYANLRCADLSSADLRSADLRYANLSSADLRSADLRYANLGYADLRCADLRSANLGYADLRSANLIIFQFQQHHAFYTLDGSLRIGCMVLPVAEWVETFSMIGKKESYSEEQILVYGQFINICMDHFNRNNPVK